MTVMPALLDALLLAAGYNTMVVMLGSALLGAGAGAVGVFVLLRRRALISDAISHATLRGLVIAFMLAAAVTGDGRVLWLMMLGAAASAALGVYLVTWIARHTRLPEDAAIGSVLSTFFALGIVLLTVVQAMPASGQAGLEGFLLGATAGMLRSEVGRNLTSRLTPSLEFILDALPESAAHIDDLLAEAQHRDAESKKLAESARYAGDADPYVRPREFEDDEDE